MISEPLTHIHRDDSGTAWIDDTGVKVLQVAQDYLGHGWSAELIKENHPALSMAQIHAAMAWFFDHEEELVAEIESRSAAAKAILASCGSQEVQQRLSKLKSGGLKN